MGVKLAAASGGSVELVPTNTASNYTATMPARTGNVAVDGPAFAATDTSTTATAATATKIVFDTTVFDTATAFDGTKFQPLVAGYYQINLLVNLGVNTVAGPITATVYKNGSAYLGSSTYQGGGYTTNAQVAVVIYFNGSTDYVEAYGRNGANANLGGAAFSGCLLRAA